jgi:hypothetical protein
MTRIARTLQDPSNPQSLSEYLSRLQRIVDGALGFGSPQDPKDPASTTFANGVANNGTLDNIQGAWFELSLNDSSHLLNTNITCTHNLNVQVLSAAQPNVRWLVFGWQHSGVGAGAGSTVDCIYTDGTVTADSIGLRFFAAARTVTDANPLKVSLFFVPAVRGVAQ